MYVLAHFLVLLFTGTSSTKYFGLGSGVPIPSVKYHVRDVGGLLYALALEDAVPEIAVHQVAHIAANHVIHVAVNQVIHTAVILQTSCG